MKSSDRKEMVARFFSWVGDGATQREAFDMLTDDADWWVSGIGSNTKAQMAEKLDKALGLFRGPIKVTVTGMVEEGDCVAVESTGDIDLVNGEHYHNHYHCMVRFRGNRICEVREYFDTAYAARLFGELMSPQPQD